MTTRASRTRLLGVSAVAALAAAGVAGGSAAAAPATASTGSSATTVADGEGSFLVLAPQGKGTSKARDRVAAAGGTVVADYARIGVLVARSTDAGFAERVRGAGVESVASTAGLGTLLDEESTTSVDAADVAAATGDPTGEPLYSLQWDMDAIDVPEAHAVTTGDADVTVGILDSGISSSHPDLRDQIAYDQSVSCIGGVQDTAEAAWNPTTSDHGTHVAGTVAAGLNGVGVTGVAPGVKVAAVKVVTDEGYIFPEAAVCGFMWAAEHGMEVTNNSYYIDPWQFNCRNDERQRPVWQAVQRAIRYSSQQGVLNVASAGNANVDLQHTFIDSGSPNDGSAPVEDRTINGACVVLPGQAPGVVTVSATGPTQQKSYFSSYGQGQVDVTAPGGDARFRSGGATSNAADAILSTTYNPATGANGYGYKQGTSMSSPHAAGVAALAISAHPRLTPNALASFLERTATPLPCPDGVYNPTPALGDTYEATCTGGARNGFYGAGEVNALAAVD
ncbi:S8 family peptidase [Phycicoccus sp. BSK3Z-2]|uniref:S8 family peptidase n=1 Tax=Phycicoccus avicenniae TaxID=2828860 RepID=A0A941I150_9MICO|nr:S8 family serine peptidase [Phycicoccus avicenniae]MBR7744575.1 S8 family peptidase [Phycicoccus avicenniae]